MQGAGLRVLFELTPLGPREVWGIDPTLQMRKLKQREVR